MARFNRAKMKALVLHALATTEPGALSSAQLNLILFLSDLVHLARFGNLITGDAYVRDRFGPAAKNLSLVRTELVADGSITERQVDTDTGPRVRVRGSPPDISPPLSVDPLTATEVAAFGLAIEHLFGLAHSREIGVAEICAAVKDAEFGDAINLQAALPNDLAAA